jgi:Group II intron, maturase-specific domain
VLVKGPARTPRRWGSSPPRCWRRWALACRRPRPDHPHRRGFDLLGLSHPAATPARHEPAVHLPVEAGPSGHHRQGADLTHKTANRSLAVLLHRLNPVLRGWCAYLQHGLSSPPSAPWRPTPGVGSSGAAAPAPHSNWKTLRRAFPPRWHPTQDRVVLFRPSTVRVSRYRGHHIPTPGRPPRDRPGRWHELVENRSVETRTSGPQAA